MNKLQFFLFWFKWKNKLNDDMFKQGMSPSIYCIAPDSFRISWDNYKRFGKNNEHNGGEQNG